MEPNKENQAQHLLIVEYSGIGSDSAPLHYSRSVRESKVGFNKYTPEEFRYLVNEMIKARGFEGESPFDPLTARLGKLLQWTGATFE